MAFLLKKDIVLWELTRRKDIDVPLGRVWGHSVE